MGFLHGLVSKTNFPHSALPALLIKRLIGLIYSVKFVINPLGSVVMFQSADDITPFVPFQYTYGLPR